MGSWLSRLTAVLALFSACLLAGPISAADSPSRLDTGWHLHPRRDPLLFFAGADIASGSAFAWSGLVGAPAGAPHDSPWRFRIMGGAGRYRYRTDAVPGGTNRVGVVSGELMLGYRLALGETTATLFLGAHIESRRLDRPNPAHRAQGVATGMKALIEFYRRLTPRLTSSASASLSSVHRAYHLRAALAHEPVPGIAFGLEGGLHGDLRYHEPRAGLFVQSTYGRTTLSLAGGYLSNSDKGDGAYATLSVHAAH